MKKIDDTGRTFKKTIKDGFFYIDKTKYLYNILKTGKTYFFLSRPRRFGKSLTISTFESIFKGEKNLFKDLYLGHTDYDFKEYNVLHFDFSKVSFGTPEEFKISLMKKISNHAEDNNIKLTSTLLKDMFEELLTKLYKNGKRVVVLVDEYDAPLTSNAFKGKEVTDYICEIMKEFFSVLKGSPEYLRFVFITGVTRYAKRGIFSKFNNFDDLSMKAEYAEMYGFTKDEILEYFDEGIDIGSKDLKLSKDEYLEKIKQHYDGYKFSLDPYYDEDDNKIYPGSVYNPISICKFFADGGISFMNYWADTGGTTLLMNMAKQTNFSLLKVDEIKVDFEDMSNLDISSLVNDTDEEKLYYLMYQAGYLTLKKLLRNSLFVLDFPNDEVRKSFSSSLLSVFLSSNKERNSIGIKIMTELERGNVNVLKSEGNVAFSSIPYELSDKNTSEREYSRTFYMLLKSIEDKENGERVFSELSSSGGRSGLIIETKSYVYIIEFKLDESVDEALSQIAKNGYSDEYKSSLEKRKIVSVGVSFSSSKVKRKYEKRKIQDIKAITSEELEKYKEN